MNPEQTKRTSVILEEIVSLQPTSETVTIQEFVTRLSDRAFGIALIIFALVNAFIPGASVIFSIPIFTMAGQMLLGQHQIWIPKKIANKGFREGIVDRVLKRIIPTLKFMEKFIRPRMTAITAPRGEKFIAVIIIFLNLLVLPPIPGLNMIPSLCICLLALALLENDGFLGLLSIIGSLLVLAFYYGVIYFVILGIMGGGEFNYDNLHHHFNAAIEKMNSNVPEVEVPGLDIDLNDTPHHAPAHTQ